ncbi:hypothetical protein OS493_040134, partial [Desmophyllum pertusum]
EKPKEVKSGFHSERRPSAIVSTAEIKAKLNREKNSMTQKPSKLFLLKQNRSATLMLKNLKHWR